MNEPFQPGIVQLIGAQRAWILGRRLGLVSHQAAVDCRGRSSAELLREVEGAELCRLFGLEHGFWGLTAAGDAVAETRHPYWDLPIVSLYDTVRKPTGEMLADLDALVFDVQDLGVRCYTYVSSLRYVLEAAAEHGCRVIVADRPIPLPAVVDGPLQKPDFASFVGYVPAPLHYGMTPGEAAGWLLQALGLDCDLKVVPMRGYDRDAIRTEAWPPFLPPSPGMRSWESAACYAATVMFEALPAIDHGRGGPLAFRVAGAPDLDAAALCAGLRARALPGVTFSEHRYRAQAGRHAERICDGVRLTVTERRAFRPVRTGLHILAALGTQLGVAQLWREPEARPDFFDKLLGTDTVREALLAGQDPATIAKGWAVDLAAFESERERHLAYGSVRT